MMKLVWPYLCLVVRTCYRESQDYKKNLLRRSIALDARCNFESRASSPDNLWRAHFLTHCVVIDSGRSLELNVATCGRSAVPGARHWPDRCLVRPSSGSSRRFVLTSSDKSGLSEGRKSLATTDICLSLNHLFYCMWVSLAYFSCCVYWRFFILE